MASFFAFGIDVINNPAVSNFVARIQLTPPPHNNKRSLTTPLCPGGGMVDALASGASTGNGVEVRVLSWAPLIPDKSLFCFTLT